MVNKMLRVKIIDENHEKDLENSVNNFLESTEYEIVDIQFRSAVSIFSEEQIYCFSAMIIYKIN
ncbi:uncharacterized protein BN451_00235 [Clostridium sp. CAG:1000]|jgi:hypothetical protein|nr:uncharacterized protein BN451_00235 [Clostridium sp. CAG:1000]